MKGLFLLQRGDIFSEFIMNLDQDFGLSNLHKVLKHQVNNSLDSALRKTLGSQDSIFGSLQVIFLDSHKVL